MNRRITIAMVAPVVILLVAAAIIFEVLNSAFGGPVAVSAGPSFRLSAPMRDVQGLVSKSLVMVRGVPVGQVAGLRRVGDRIDVTLAVDPRKVTVYRDAGVRVGHRTLFGEAYVRLDPGLANAGRLSSGTHLADAAVHATVRLDDALKAFGPSTRRSIKSLNRTAASVDADPAARAELNGTLGALAETVGRLRTLTGELDGQQSALTRFVSSSRVVLDELAGRDDQVRDTISAGRRTAQAATASLPALRATIGEAGALLRDARSTLTSVRPLLTEARPVLQRTTRAAPGLTRALIQTRPVAWSAGTLITALPAFTATARPVLARLRRVSPILATTLRATTPALRDLNPILRQLYGYRAEVQGFFNTGTTAGVLRADGTSSPPNLDDIPTDHPMQHPGEDGPYGWARFIYDGNTGAITATPQGIGTNPYPQPGKPYEHFSGTYPRIAPDPEPAP